MKVKIQPANLGATHRGRFDFLMTNNGYQWSGFSTLTVEQLRILQQNLNAFMENHPPVVQEVIEEVEEEQLDFLDDDVDE